MATNSTMPTPSSTEGEQFLCDDWFDPLENGVRTRIRGFIEELLEAELDAALGRARYERPGAGGGDSPESFAGSRHGHRKRRILGTFGATTVRVPRARLTTPEGKTTEWRNATIPAYQRRTKRADALIAGAYLSGTNTRRVRRALAALFGGAVGKDTVSRVWRKTKGDWDVWNARSLADEPIVRLILDGTVVRVRLDKKATSISLLVALGVRADGQKVLLAIKNMGGESEAAWRALLDNLVSRGERRTPSSSTAVPAWTRRWRRSGPMCRFSAARSTSTVISSLTRRIGCMRRSRPTTTTWFTPRPAKRSRPNEKPSSENGGSNAAQSPTAWKRQATDCSLSRASRRANGSRSEPRTPSNACTRNSSGGSRRRPSCRALKRPPCSSGHCWPRDRS